MSLRCQALHLQASWNKKSFCPLPIKEAEVRHIPSVDIKRNGNIKKQIDNENYNNYRFGCADLYFSQCR